MARPAPAKPRAPDAKLIERIFACLAPGLPQDWDKTWIVVTDLGAAQGKERQFEAQFFFTTPSGDDKGEPLTPCNSKGLALQVHDMNDLLAPEKRNWRKAQLLITSEGRFELKYDYPQ
jgi:hypothetical protein